MIREVCAEYLTQSGKDRSILVTGLERSSGGVVIAVNGEDSGPQYLTDFAAGSAHDPYFRDVVSQAYRLQKTLILDRMGRATPMTGF